MGPVLYRRLIAISDGRPGKRAIALNTVSRRSHCPLRLVVLTDSRICIAIAVHAR